MTENQSGKVREFWICQGSQRGRDFVCTGNETRQFDGLHVIEKSAYTKAVEALKDMGCQCYENESDKTITCVRCKTLRELGEVE